jgi:hypothetical protein
MLKFHFRRRRPTLRARKMRESFFGVALPWTCASRSWSGDDPPRESCASKDVKTMTLLFLGTIEIVF